MADIKLFFFCVAVVVLCSELQQSQAQGDIQYCQVSLVPSPNSTAVVACSTRLGVVENWET